VHYAACDHLFCENFDDGAKFQRWTSWNKSGALLDIKPDDATSPPNSLWLRTDDVTTSTFAVLAKRFDSDAGGFSCTIDVLVSNLPDAGADTILAIGVEGPDAAPDYYAGLALIPSGSGTVLMEGEQRYTGGPNWGLGAWNRVIVKVTLASKSLEVTVADGEPKTRTLPSAPASATAYTLKVGLIHGTRGTADSALPLEVHFDTVTCDAL
jgi:hypothetical protein